MNNQKLKIEVCVGTSCHLMGSNLIIEYLERLSEKVKAQLEIKYISCMNNCSQGPQVKVGNCQLANATPELLNDRIEKILLQ